MWRLIWGDRKDNECEAYSPIFNELFSDILRQWCDTWNVEIELLSCIKKIEDGT